MTGLAAAAEKSFYLGAGRHHSAARGRCALEWIAHLTGESHSDSPRSVSRVLAAFARSWNDALDDKTRQRLRPFLARMIGTADDGLDDARAWTCADWLTRVSAPAFLEHAGFAEEADRLRQLPVVDAGSCDVALAAVRVARRRAAVVRHGLRAEITARHPGALDAARHATRSIPAAAGWSAARAGLAAADSGRQRDVLADLAWHAGWDAAWVAAWRDGPDGAARMRPVTALVQGTAFQLLEEMLPKVRLDVVTDETARLAEPTRSAVLVPG
jgi:hypothetical protein